MVAACTGPCMVTLGMRMHPVYKPWPPGWTVALYLQQSVCQSYPRSWPTKCTKDRGLDEPQRRVCLVNTAVEQEVLLCSRGNTAKHCCCSVRLGGRNNATLDLNFSPPGPLQRDLSRPVVGSPV